MLQHTYGICVSETSLRILCTEHQVTNGMLILVPFFKVQCQLRGNFGSVLRICQPELLSNSSMELGSAHTGQTAVENLPKQCMFKFIVGRNRAIGELPDSYGPDEQLLFG